MDINFKHDLFYTLFYIYEKRIVDSCCILLNSSVNDNYNESIKVLLEAS